MAILTFDPNPVTYPTGTDKAEQQQNDKLATLVNYYQDQTVPTYAAYVLACKGPQKKFITVQVDESDENQINNVYQYRGDDQVNPDPQF